MPDVVLMPKAVLPLHVFEPRYRAMTRDTLAGNRMITIALLKSGYESRYHTLDVAIHREVCVGRVLREERLPDGRYNLLIQGLTRAVIQDENTELSYRRGQLKPIRSIEMQPDVECALKRELRGMLQSPSLVTLARKANWLELFKCPDFTFSDVVDVLASAVLPSAEEKQRFLSEPRVEARARYIRDVMCAVRVELDKREGRPIRMRSWPPELCDN